MPQSLARIYLHIVFSTKHRTPFLEDDALRAELHRYLAGTCNALESPAIRVGGTADHVHIACACSRKLAVMDLVKKVKGASSRWIKGNGAALATFAWQAGYGAFSVSPSHLPALDTYIAKQEQHHRTTTFQDEMRRLLDRYGVDFDERYVWD